MWDAIIALCIQHRALVIFAVLLAGALGVRAAQRLPIDAVPDVTNVQVQVLTNAPALGPIEVEQLITAPVEGTLGGLPRVEEVRSLSRFGLSSVTVVFEDGTDPWFARQLVDERLSEAREAIPPGYGTPELGPASTGLGEIYHIEVRGEPRCEEGAPDTTACWSAMELRSLLDTSIARQLRPLPGVVEINAFGGELRTWEVQVEPERLNALGLTLTDVFAALEGNNANAGGGYIVHHGEQRLIRGEGRVQALDDVRDVRLTTRADGTPVFIRDIAQVEFAPQLRQGAVTRDGRGEVVTGTVMMLGGANASDVTAAVRQRLDELAPTLPPGVTIETWYDRDALVERTIRTVAVNLIEGGALVIVVLLLLLGNLRAGLLVAVVIPLSLLITFIFMLQFHVSANLMSLGALDFGLIIDGAIVVVENIARRLADPAARGPNLAATVRAATAQVARPVVFGTLIIMIVYIPILTLQGIEGRMFTPMAVTVLIALGAALLLALTLMPAAATVVFAAGVSEREPGLARLVRRAYEPLLQRAARRPGVALAFTLIGLAAGVAVASSRGAEFLPRLDEGAIAMQAIRPPSVALEESVEATSRVEQLLLDAFPDEIATVVSRTGRAEVATDPMGAEISDIYILLHPPAQWRRATDREGLVAAMERELRRQAPGQNYVFSQPIELRTNELISGARADVAVNLYGPELAELDRLGDAIAQELRDVPGAADVNADPTAGLPTLRVVVDRRAAARYGINAREVLDAVEALGGRPVGVAFEGEQRWTLQVRLAEHARRDQAAIESLLIAAPGGLRVPLAQVADVSLDEGPAVINRERAQRRRTIQVNVRGRDLAGFVAEARSHVAREVELPPGYTIAWGGQLKNLEAATDRLFIAVPAALLLIAVLLYTAFGAVRPALLIYLNVPFAATGGVFALAARGMPFSISAAVGFIALSGIAVLNGVVLVSAIRDLQAEGHALPAATLEGARQRLRPVLMTALTDGLGFLPMALSTSAGAEVQRPLATVVLGGLVTSTLLTLFVLPALYSRFGGSYVGPLASTAPEAPGQRDEGAQQQAHR